MGSNAVKTTFAIVLSSALACAVLGWRTCSVARERDTADQRADQATEKARRFDAFCNQQRIFLGVVADHLRSGKQQEVATKEYDEVFVDQAGGRDLTACLDGTSWDPDRAEDCAVHKDATCMLDEISKTMSQLSAATR